MNAAPDAAGRAKALRAATHATHERLDQRIMAAEPLSSRARYGCFLQLQHAFHRDIDTLYSHAPLSRLFPGLDRRRRLGLIEQDLSDLGIPAPATNTAPVFKDANVQIPVALGWLYVVEGSNLGAAFLLKEAARLGLSDTFGARHLAGAPEGRGLHWRTFTAALDSVALSPTDETYVVDGPGAAFRRVYELAQSLLPLTAPAHAIRERPMAQS
jgi:heme oxygenase (biliverdin-IX-beta and delta-forming)